MKPCRRCAHPLRLSTCRQPQRRECMLRRHVLHRQRVLLVLLVLLLLPPGRLRCEASNARGEAATIGANHVVLLLQGLQAGQD